jgi:hypothetical protein
MSAFFSQKLFEGSQQQKSQASKKFFNFFCLLPLKTKFAV